MRLSWMFLWNGGLVSIERELSEDGFLNSLLDANVIFNFMFQG